MVCSLTGQAPSKFCCQNKKCPDYGKRGAKNLTICGWFGKNNHIRLLYCRPRVFLSKTRAGARLVGVHPDTVTRYSRAAGEHAQAIHDELVAFSPRNKRGSVRPKVGICRQERKAL